jgi:membrane-associated phospholipid phosphatase
MLVLILDFWALGRPFQRGAMSHIGHLGHSAILFPASLAFFGCLLWFDRRADAIAFSAALAACLLATLVAKLAFHACGSEISAFGIESPSGHTSFSATFYGCLALIVTAGRPLWQRTGIYAGTALLVLLVGVSRVLVEAHTAPDVIAGTSIGMSAILVFQVLRGPSRPFVMPTWAMALAIPASAVLALTILVFARHWTPEDLIKTAGLRIDRFFGVCMSP